MSASFSLFIGTATTEIYTLSLHDALPISVVGRETHPAIILGHPAGVGDEHVAVRENQRRQRQAQQRMHRRRPGRSEEHTSELQSLRHLVCRLLLEKKKKKNQKYKHIIMKK